MTTMTEMSVGFLFKNLIILFSLSSIVHGTSKNIQCKAIDNSTVKSLFVPDTYSVNVEVKLVNERKVHLIREDREDDISSLKITNTTHIVHCLYHYRQRQLVTYTEDLRGRKKECQVTTLEPKTPCIPHSPWTIPLHELRQMKKFSWFPEHKEYPRGIDTLHLELCEYDTNHTLYMKLDAYIAVSWMLPRSNKLVNLVRIKFSLPKAHVISDYVDFSTDAHNPEHFLLPRGTFCPGLNISSLKPPQMNMSFSVNTEIVDLNKITNERNSPPVLVPVPIITEGTQVKMSYLSVVYDWATPGVPASLGYKYIISLRNGKCKTQQKIQLGDYFVKGCLGNAKCEMSDPDNYIHMDNAEIQYAGKREVRGVICNVWVGKYQDIFTTAVNTIEWYYTSKSWEENVGTKQEDSVPFRMDIWEPGTDTPSIHNFMDFDMSPKVWSQFDISSCFSKHDERIRFTVRLKASSGDTYLLPYTTDDYAVQYLRNEFSTFSRINPILLTQTMVDYDVRKAVVYLTSTLLSGPKEQNPKFGSKHYKLITDVVEDMSNITRLKEWSVFLPIQLGSKLMNLQLTADKIRTSVLDAGIDRPNPSTTPLSATIAPKTPTAQHTSMQTSATTNTSRPVTTATSFTANTLRTLDYSDNQKRETDSQTEPTVKFTTESKTTQPTSIKTEESTVIQTSTSSTIYATGSSSNQEITTPSTSTSVASSKFKPPVVRETTIPSVQTPTAINPLKSTVPSRATSCVCPTTASNSSSCSKSSHGNNVYSTATLVGCVCGSFVVGILFAFVIVSFYSVFCRRKRNDDSNSDHHALTNMPYRILE